MMEKTEQAVKQPVDALEAYNATFKAETEAMIDLLNGLLSGSRTGQEVNEQLDQHFANMDRAAEQYWQARKMESVMMLKVGFPDSDLSFKEG